MGHSRPLFIYFRLLNTVYSKQVNVLDKSLPMTGLEPWTPGVGSDRSTNWATTTALEIKSDFWYYFSDRLRRKRPARLGLDGLEGIGEIESIFETLVVGLEAASLGIDRDRRPRWALLRGRGHQHQECLGSTWSDHISTLQSQQSRRENGELG